MRKDFTLAIALVLIAVAVSYGLAGWDCIKGSGNVITETRQIGEFERLKLSGGYDLILTQGTSPELRIEAEDNIQKHIEATAEGGELRISMKDKICRSKQIKVYLTAVNLKSIDCSGAVDITSTNKITSDVLKIDISGAGEVEMDIEADELISSISGAGEMDLDGTAKSHKIKISGAGDVDAVDLVVNKYDIHLSGASDCRINVLDELYVETSGASSIAYKGNPAKVEKKTSGASSIRQMSN